MKNSIKMPSYKKALCIGMAVLIFFIACFAYYEYSYKDYIETDAKVISVTHVPARRLANRKHIAEKFDVECEYIVNGQTYQNTLSYQDYVDYKTGDSITVLYDPNNPFSLKDVTSENTFVLCVIYTVGITAVVTIILFATEKKKIST